MEYFRVLRFLRHYLVKAYKLYLLQLQGSFPLYSVFFFVTVATVLTHSVNISFLSPLQELPHDLITSISASVLRLRLMTLMICVMNTLMLGNI